jgi:hypothetical protein
MPEQTWTLDDLHCLLVAARAVCERWDSGDLAGAVRDLNDLLEDFPQVSMADIAEED